MTLLNNHKINKKVLKYVWAFLAAALLSGTIFFFTYYKVEKIEVMGSSHYTDEEIKGMVLRGPLASNSVLAPMLYSVSETEDIPFVSGFSVTQINRNTICISVKEKKPVGCIPYLDSYIYFDRSGIFVESSRQRDETIPYFDGITVKKVVMGEKLPIKGDTVLNTAVALATIFQKNDTIPDHIEFDKNYEISLLYGDITVMLGKDQYLEDKMNRVLAILPQIQGQKGILHLENVTDNSKTITFERDLESITAENWTGGYNEYGEYTGDGLYDEDGIFVGERPKEELDYALENWKGGYDGEGDYTGYGEYDEYGNYVGSQPTQESLDARGDWKGGFMEDGSYTGYGEYDYEGNYVGSNPAEESGGSGEESDGSQEDYGDGSDESYYDESYYDESYYDESYYDESYYDEGYYE